MKILLHSTILLYCTPLHLFYDMNGVAGLNWKKIGSFMGQNIKTVEDRPYTRKNKEITRCSRQKAQNSMVLMCGSELRIGSKS